jgi:hypothetical protein
MTTALLPVRYVDEFMQLTGLVWGNTKPIASRHLPPVATS